MRIALLLAGLALAGASLAAKAPAAMGPEKLLDSYYPPASLRLGETGSIIVHFTISPEGQAVIVTSANENEHSPSPRLIAGAERLLHDVHFDPESGRNRLLTARIVFQMHPCKATTRSPDTDYNFDVCGQRQCQPQYTESMQGESGPKAALHAILNRGDLSDIDSLSQELHLGLKLRAPKRSDHLVAWNAVPTTASEYVNLSGFTYTAVADENAGKTKIELRFYPKGPWAVCKWGKEWKQKEVDVGDEMIMDSPGLSHFETLHWGDDDGIAVRTDTFSGAILTQTIPRTVIFPERLILTRRADTHLLERVVDVLLAGDLRDFRHVGKLLHAELDAKEHSSTEPGWLYGVLEQPIDGADSTRVYYDLDDFGWGHWLGWTARDPQPQARTVELNIYVETAIACLSPESVAEELDKRKARYQINQNDVAGRTYVVPGDNMISLTARVADSCIQNLALHQITDFQHDVAYPLKFLPRDATHVSSQRLTSTGRAKVKALLWRLDRRTLCGIRLVLHPRESTLNGGGDLRERRLAELVKHSLIDGGLASERIQIVNVSESYDDSEGDPPPFVTVQESAPDCSQPRPSRMPW